ncbi:MAG: transglutaminase domain-containing protein [Myxococcota bacterium]
MSPRVARNATLLVLCLGVAAVARAQDPILHEFVPDVRADEALVYADPNNPEPSAIVYDGEVLPAPEDGALQEDERPMVASSGDGIRQEEPGRRSASFRPDRITELESTLGYFTVFTPAIAPFKRVTALDAVVMDGGTPVLQVADTRGGRMAVEGANSSPPDDRDRDRFWGSVVLDFGAGMRVPLPSVSPESRILSLRTEPPISLRVERDPADNYYARALGTLPTTQIRLTFLTDAPKGYFNRPVPAAASDALSHEAAELPPGLQADAEAFAGELGLIRGMPMPLVLGRLTEHFRNFEEADQPPEDTGNIYLDLSRGQKGVCRHRSYGFMITASALGIPTRFVMNEAHAWVEVKLADAGWMRIDLGGAAAGLEAHNADDRPVYRPAEPDPLPRPQPYQDSYSQLNNVDGLREETPGGTEAGSAGGQTGSSGTSGGSSTGGSSSGGSTSGDEPRMSEARDQVRLTLNESEYDVFRGRTISVNGRATAASSGLGAEGLRLEVRLRGDGQEMPLGVTVTRAEGHFQGSFGVPPDIAVGEYELMVTTPGNETYFPATAR